MATTPISPYRNTTIAGRYALTDNKVTWQYTAQLNPQWIALIDEYSTEQLNAFAELSRFTLDARGNN